MPPWSYLRKSAVLKAIYISDCVDRRDGVVRTYLPTPRHFLLEQQNKPWRILTNAKKKTIFVTKEKRKRDKKHDSRLKTTTSVICELDLCPLSRFQNKKPFFFVTNREIKFATVYIFVTIDSWQISRVTELSIFCVTFFLCSLTNDPYWSLSR